MSTKNNRYAIRLSRPGVKRCGEFEAGVIYQVPEDVDDKEAKRLIAAKGFEIVGKEEE